MKLTFDSVDLVGVSMPTMLGLLVLVIGLFQNTKPLIYTGILLLVVVPILYFVVQYFSNILSNEQPSRREVE